jgi:hypothetical protein
MKTLVFLGCSKKKLSVSAPALIMYQGMLFKLGKIIAQKIGADIRIISAKYGVIVPGQIIEPYDQKMTISRAKEIAEDPVVISYLNHLFSRNYDCVFVIAGKTYQRILESWWDYRFTSLIRKGIGYSMANLKNLIRNPDFIANFRSEVRIGSS